VKTPFPVTRKPDELHFTYLDTVGRPVIIMEKSNLLEQHIEEFVVGCSWTLWFKIPHGYNLKVNLAELEKKLNLNNSVKFFACVYVSFCT